MAYASGLSAQVGYAAETTYGTRATPSRFLEFLDESLDIDVARVESNALRAGSAALRTDRWAAGRKSAAGTIRHELGNKGFGLLFKHMLGTVAISTPGGGTATRDHLHTVGDPSGLMLTVQVGRPDVGGTVRPWDYYGCKVASWRFGGGLDEIPVLELTLDGQTVDTAQSLASASYPSSQAIYDWTQVTTFTIGGASYTCRSVYFTGNNSIKTDRYGLGSQLKSQPIRNAKVDIGGEIDSEYVDNTAVNRFINGTTAAIQCIWVGATIEGSLKYQITVDIPTARFDGENPKVGGADILSQPLRFKAIGDSTENASSPIAVTYRTTDTAS